MQNFNSSNRKMNIFYTNEILLKDSKILWKYALTQQDEHFMF